MFTFYKFNTGAERSTVFWK